MTKTNKFLIRVHNSETNEIIDREMTKEEIIQFEKIQAELTESSSINESKAVQRQAILDRLGLTPEEAALLLS